jgi:hypothetical protein
MRRLATVAALTAFTTSAAGTTRSGITPGTALSHAAGIALASETRTAGTTVPAYSAIPTSSTVSAVTTLSGLGNKLEVRCVGVGNRYRLIVRIGSVFSPRAICTRFAWQAVSALASNSTGIVVSARARLAGCSIKTSFTWFTVFAGDSNRGWV